MQWRDSKARYEELRQAEAWAEHLLIRKQLYFTQCRHSIPDDEYNAHRREYEMQWELEWNALERKLLNGSGVPAMVKKQLGEQAKVRAVQPSAPRMPPMPEYVGKRLLTIHELEEEYLPDDDEENDEEE